VTSVHSGRLHQMAVEWFADRANQEEGGLGVFADTRFCLDLTKLLQRVERAANSRVFNVAAIEVVPIEQPIGGERWVQLRCHYAGDDSPLLVQLPERAWIEMSGTQFRGESTGAPTSGETVNHPRHYNEHPSGVECIVVVEHFSFNVGNAIKYLWRAGLKGGTDPIEDLKKAAWYVNREIERLTVSRGTPPLTGDSSPR